MNKTSQLHLRFIAGIFFLLSLVGVYDYIMILMRNTAYYNYLGYGERQIAYFTNYPVTLMILLTLGVWGSVMGSILLLFRSRWALASLSIALLSQTILDVYTFAIRSRWEILGSKLGTQDLIILLLTLGMTLYALSLHKRKIIL